jgi:hypothetical protein
MHGDSILNWLQDLVTSWREIKERIEEYCKKKDAEKSIPPIFNRRNIIYHLKLNDEEAKHVRYALTTLVKEGKLSKYGSHTYRWHRV